MIVVIAVIPVNVNSEGNTNYNVVTTLSVEVSLLYL